MKKALAFYLILAHAIVSMEPGPQFFLESIHNNTSALLFLKSSNSAAIELKPHSENVVKQPLLTTISNTNGFIQITCGQEEASEVGEDPKTYPYIVNDSNEPSRFFSFSCIFQPVRQTDLENIKSVMPSLLHIEKTHHTPAQRITDITEMHFMDEICTFFLRIVITNKDCSASKVVITPKASPASLLKQCAYKVLQFEQQQKLTIKPEKLSQELNYLIAQLKVLTNNYSDNDPFSS